MTMNSLLVGLSLLAAAGLGYVAANAKSGTMTAADQLEWRERRPGSPVKMVILWGNPNMGEYATLLKFPAGFVAPIHAHTGDYHGMSLSGTWRHSFEGGEERDLPPGSYVFQPGLEMHGDACVGSQDCVLFIHQYVKDDFIPKQVNRTGEAR
jgi:quercetin dioxygenase-like cupin family protein